MINADDLGLAESVNRGILESIEKGVVTSASLLVNMPGCDDAMERLRAWRSGAARKGLSVGLHFNITAGSPLGACATLLDARRRFLPLPTLAWRALRGRIDERDVERELEAQLDRAKRLLAPLAMRVTHIDSHRHVHCFPVVYDAVVRAAKRHWIGHVRHPYAARALLWRPRALLASRVLRAVASNRRPMDDVGFAGVGAMGSRTFDRDIAAVLTALPPGTTELMVHPGYDSPELAAIDPYRAPRERELRVLTSAALRNLILELGVELTPFGATAPSASPPIS